MTADDRLDGAFKRVAAAWRGTSVIGQQSFDDVFTTHPDISDDQEEGLRECSGD